MTSLGKPLISIGVPVYNGENFVAEALACILDQSYEHLEVIVSDNASNDGTSEICRAFAQQDSRVRYYRADVNRGAAWNFNRVFELATGEFFRWASHDDLSAPSLDASCVEVLQDCPDVVLCAGKAGVIDAQGRQILGDNSDDPDSFYTIQGTSRAAEQRRIDLGRSPRPSDRYRGILLHSRRCYEVYGLMRRESMAASIGHPSYCGGDKVWLAQMSLMGKIWELPETLFFSRWHDARFSNNDSADAQKEHMDPMGLRLSWVPHQATTAAAYGRIIHSVPMTVTERRRCWQVWLRFCFQVHKWSQLVKYALTGTADSVHVPPTPRYGPCPIDFSSLDAFRREWESPPEAESESVHSSSSP